MTNSPDTESWKLEPERTGTTSPPTQPNRNSCFTDSIFIPATPLPVSTASRMANVRTLVASPLESFAPTYRVAWPWSSKIFTNCLHLGSQAQNKMWLNLRAKHGFEQETWRPAHVQPSSSLAPEPMTACSSQERPHALYLVFTSQHVPYHPPNPMHTMSEGILLIGSSGTLDRVQRVYNSSLSRHKVRRHYQLLTRLLSLISHRMGNAQNNGKQQLSMPLGPWMALKDTIYLRRA